MESLFSYTGLPIMDSSEPVLNDTTTPALLIVANGPGEIAGWVLPIAREIRTRVEAAALRLVLIMPPSQFASGSEQRLAASSGLFDHIAPPRECLRLALGLASLRTERPAALLHLGGDLWFSRRLGARWSIPAFAFAETSLIARHHRAFREIFVPSPRIASLLVERGVDAARVSVAGDPRLDHLPRRDGSHPDPRSRALRVTMLAGSRERFFRLLFPLWAEAAIHLRLLRPDAAISIAIAPLLPARAVEGVIRPWQERLAASRITLAREGTPEAIAECDLVITIPGTTTMEVAALPVAALVVLPMQMIGAAPAEGMLEWVLRIPLVGPWAKRMIAPVIIARHRYVSLPNRLSGRAILPELVGTVTPEGIAEHASALLGDEGRLREIEEALRDLAGPRGAAGRIAERILGEVAV